MVNTCPPDEYMKLIAAYHELEKLSFSPADSKECVLERLEERNEKKRRIADAANALIREHIEPFEACPEKMTEADARMLTGFMQSLIPEGLYTGQVTDLGMLYRVSKLLNAHYRRSGDLNAYALALDRCSYGYRAYIQSHYPQAPDSPYTEECIALVRRISELDEKTRRNALYALSRTVVVGSDRFPAERLHLISDLMHSNLKQPHSDKDELLVLIMECNIVDAFSEHCFYSHSRGIPADISAVRPFVEGLCEHLGSCVAQNRTYGVEKRKIEKVLHTAEFIFGDLPLDELLDTLTVMQKQTEDSPNPSQSGFGLGEVSHDYLSMLYEFSPLPEEEILRLSRDRIREVMSKLLPLSRRVNNPQFNRYLFKFLNAASLTGSFDDFADVILEAAVYADRPLFIHTVMVREISMVIFDEMFERSPEAFDGVAGRDTAYIRSHREEMQKLLSDCCMFHDIGKFFLLDIVENSMRRLTDDEFELIKRHPENFDNICQMNGSQSERVLCIRDCAVTHHLWHDGTRGYPNVRQTKNRPFADILAIADGLDAATDSYGRPYRTSKTLDVLIGEFQAGAGTQYGPEAAAVLSVPSVRERIEALVTEGRKEINYRIYTGGKA